MKRKVKAFICGDPVLFSNFLYIFSGSNLRKKISFFVSSSDKVKETYIEEQIFFNEFDVGRFVTNTLSRINRLDIKTYTISPTFSFEEEHFKENFDLLIYFYDASETFREIVEMATPYNIKILVPVLGKKPEVVELGIDIEEEVKNLDVINKIYNPKRKLELLLELVSKTIKEIKELYFRD